MNDESTDVKKTDIKTSQKDFSLVEGNGGGSTESTIPENGGGKGSFSATSQQLRGEHHLVEGK